MSKAPVFVLGCPRSGTTMLYYMLLSSGNFAVYREESSVFNLLAPRFGDLRVLKNRQAMMDLWERTQLFTATGLPASAFRQRVLRESRNAGDFLRIVMEEVARSQNVERWAETTNEHLLYLPEIKKTIPDALVIHIIRDGRDVALSMEKLGWVHTFPWNPTEGLMVTGLYWQWLVNAGRQNGRRLGPDYMEVRFEELVTQPRETLAAIGRFIDHDLDYDRIRHTAIGVVGKPNTSFASETQGSGFSPLGRWRKYFSPEQTVLFESLMGDFLRELGYPLETPPERLTHGLKARRLSAVCAATFNAKQWLKAHTPVLRWRGGFPAALLDGQRLSEAGSD